MGLFDRLRSAGHAPADGSESKPDTSVQEASRLIDEGNALEDAGRLEDAMQRYEAALLLVPDFARAYLNRGNILSAKGDTEGALAAYSTAIKCNPDYAGAHYNLGNASARLGRLEAAVDAYQNAIRLQSDYADAEVALGGVLEDLERDDEAVAHYQAALTLNPQHAGAANNLARFLVKTAQHMLHSERYAELERLALLVLEHNPDSGFAWNILGASLQLQGKDGLPALRKAVVLLPDNAEAHVNLGNAQKDLGQLNDAVASYQRALRIKPDFAEAHNNLGIILQELRHIDEAMASYYQALRIKPDYAEAHYNLGITLQELGRLDEAEASCRRALEIKPDYAEAYSNLGNILKDLGQLDGAVASYHRALEIKPDYADAHNNLGNALQDLGQFNEAMACYRRALEIKPDYFMAHNNLGNALQDLGQLDEAMASYRQALVIKPDYAMTHSNLGNILNNLGQCDEAVASFRRALEIKPDYAVVRSNLLFSYNLLACPPPAEMLAEAMSYGERVARQARPYTSWPNIPEPTRCLRVGLVSGDLRQHPVGNFLENMLAALVAHADGQLELFAYPSHSNFDAVTERIKACCDGWHSAVGLSDENLAKQIREDGIDILIDLSGHTAHNRLPMFAWKPAPVQVTWLGYLATTGVAAMDYLIADSWTLQESEEAHFTETIWRLPETYLCFTPPDMELAVSPLPALANGHVTFGSFNNLVKMNDAVVALWARVLKAVPRSRLLLKAKQFREDSVLQRVIERFAAHGVGADRLILKNLVPRAEYLAPYQQVDIALDTFPYPGITTSVEALWMGVPVLTLAGECFLSRQGVGLLMNSGLPEWIAADADDYVARAVSHASDLQRLAALRNGLRQQVMASPVFDAPRFAGHFENALRSMWKKWCDTENNSRGTSDTDLLARPMNPQ